MPDFCIAVKSFIIKDGKLLIIKRSDCDRQNPGTWEIPGGRLEPGEEPQTGLVRETKEETGLEITVANPLSVRHFRRDDGQIITMITFLCNALCSDVKLSKEHTAFEWIDMVECKQKLGEFFHRDLDLYMAHFSQKNASWQE